MIPTPSLSHLKKADYARVYEPAEDTFVFLDALELDAERLTSGGTRPRVVCEIGFVRAHKEKELSYGLID